MTTYNQIESVTKRLCRNVYNTPTETLAIAALVTVPTATGYLAGAMHANTVIPPPYADNATMNRARDVMIKEAGLGGLAGLLFGVLIARRFENALKPQIPPKRSPSIRLP